MDSVWIGEAGGVDHGGVAGVFATEELALAWLREVAEIQERKAKRMIDFEVKQGYRTREDADECWKLEWDNDYSFSVGLDYWAISRYSIRYMP